MTKFRAEPTTPKVTHPEVACHWRGQCLGRGYNQRFVVLERKLEVVHHLVELGVGLDHRRPCLTLVVAPEIEAKIVDEHRQLHTEERSQVGKRAPLSRCPDLGTQGPRPRHQPGSCGTTVTTGVTTEGC